MISHAWPNILKNSWGNKTKREVYDNVIEFKDRRKNTYQWDPEDEMDGLLEDPNPHETAPNPAEFPGVEFDADMDEAVAAPQEVAGDNATAAAASTNANILHGTSTANYDKNENNNIKEVGIYPNDPTELINVDAGSDGDHKKEEHYDNPVDTLYQNQNNTPNTTSIPVTTAFDNCIAGDNPNGAVEMEDAEEDNDCYDASDSKDDDNSTKGVYNRNPMHNRNKNTHRSHH